MTWKLKTAALAACAVLLGLSFASAAPFQNVPDAGDSARAPAAPRHMPAAPRHASSAVGCSGPSVTVAGAVLCGLSSTRQGAAVDVYENITYATQKARWQNSSVVAPVSGNATHFGPICYQPHYDPVWPAMAEDCLNLNVWTPHGAAAGSLPVMVFIHGGAFISGHGSGPMFDGSALAQQGVVLVTLNYRLGALGFLASNDGAVNALGNMGLLDQQNAMKWVQSYIAAFGGNPSQVTIFGESAGAMSVGFHLFSMPSSDTLFRAAIMESNPMGNVYNSQAQFDPAGASFLTALCNKYNSSGACDLNWFQTGVTLDQVIAEQNVFLGSGLSTRGIEWAPVIDNTVVMGQPFAGYATGNHAKPFVFGVNQDEGVLFATYAGGSSTAPSQWIYENILLGPAFGSSNVPSILQKPPYNIATGSYCAGTECYYSSWGQSYADVLTDYSFVTGNLAAGMTSQGPFIPPVFIYSFTQAPIFDLYPKDHGACQPSQKHVCHGNELPYVFNTLLTQVSDPGNDQKLADTMTADWASFAKQPLAPGADWTRFNETLSTTATNFGNNTATPLQPFFPGSYESFWAGWYPPAKGK